MKSGMSACCIAAQHGWSFRHRPHPAACSNVAEIRLAFAATAGANRRCSASAITMRRKTALEPSGICPKSTRCSYARKGCLAVLFLGHTRHTDRTDNPAVLHDDFTAFRHMNVKVNEA